MRGELLDELEQLRLTAGLSLIGEVFAVDGHLRHGVDPEAPVEEIRALQLRLHCEGGERFLEIVRADAMLLEERRYLRERTQLIVVDVDLAKVCRALRPCSTAARACAARRSTSPARA